MKKLLLASVATLALAAFAAGQAQAADATSGLKLGLGGYFSVQGAYADQSDGTSRGVAQPGNNKSKTGVFEYGELHFTAEKAFDNGLTAGYQAVLELPQTVSNSATTTAASTTTGVTVRQDYGYFSGNWGRFEAGQNYSPVYYMGVSAPSVNDEFDSFDPDFNLVNITAAGAGTQTGVANTLGAGNYATVGFTPFYHDGQDGLLSDKVVYYTPRFNGFQLGASFTPSDNGKNIETATTGFASSNTFSSQDNRLEAGVSYDGKFSGVGIKAAGGYGHGTLAGRSVGGATVSQLKDEQAWIGGVQLSLMNWTLGGGYLWDNNGQSFKSGGLTADGESGIWNAGLGYAVGPYHAGVSYYDNETDTIHTTTATFKSNDKLQRWVVGGGYGVAPGVDLNTTLQFDKYKTADSYINAAGNTNATVFTLGTTVNF